jgi:hypothetical protein
MQHDESGHVSCPSVCLPGCLSVRTPVGMAVCLSVCIPVGMASRCYTMMGGGGWSSMSTEARAIALHPRGCKWSFQPDKTYVFLDFTPLLVRSRLWRWMDGWTGR